MNEKPKTDYLVSASGSGRKVRQLRETPEFLQEPVHSLCAQAENQNAPSPEGGLASDNSHSPLDVQVTDSISIMSTKAVAAGAEVPFDSPQHRPQTYPNDVRFLGGSDVLFQFSHDFKVVGREPDRGSNDGLLRHSESQKVTGNSVGKHSTEVVQASPDYQSDIAGKPDSGSTDEIDELIVTVPIGDIFPGIGAFVFVDGEFKPSAPALPSLRGAWKYLSEQESGELNPHLLDDLRIAKLCLLQLEAGNPDPWRFAFWSYMGITPEKWQGIRAEREAFEKTLGPTLAEEMENPLFLSSLDSLVLAQLQAKRPQSRFAFSPKERGIA